MATSNVSIRLKTKWNQETSYIPPTLTATHPHARMTLLNKGFSHFLSIEIRLIDYLDCESINAEMKNPF